MAGHSGRSPTAALNWSPRSSKSRNMSNDAQAGASSTASPSCAKAAACATASCKVPARWMLPYPAARQAASISGADRPMSTSARTLFLTTASASVATSPPLKTPPAMTTFGSGRASSDFSNAAAFTLEALDKAFDQALASFLAQGLDEGALERARTRLVADAIYARDSQSDLARWYGASLALGQSVREVEEWPAKIDAVDAPAVIAAARRWLEHKPAVTGHLRAPEAAAA